MNPVNVKSNTYISPSKEIDNKILNVKSMTLLEYQTVKKIYLKLPKAYVPNWYEKVSLIKKVKNSVPWTYVNSDRNEKETVESFMTKNCGKQIKKRNENKNEKK